MNASFLKFAMALLGSVASLALHAAPRAVEPFAAQTWQSLQASLSQPVVVVFSTTDCAYCPAVIDRLALEIRDRKLKATLIAVVMDAAPGESDRQLMRDAHYRRVDRLFAFSGQAAALRHSVDPSWRGVTPFVAFMVPRAPPVWVTGTPSTGEVAAWVQKAAARIK